MLNEIIAWGQGSVALVVAEVIQLTLTLELILPVNIIGASAISMDGKSGQISKIYLILGSYSHGVEKTLVHRPSLVRLASSWIKQQLPGDAEVKDQNIILSQVLGPAKWINMIISAWQQVAEMMLIRTLSRW